MTNNNNLKVVFGAMTFGKPDTLGARVHNTQDAAKILDIFQSHGHNEVDTARIYGAGSSEEILAAAEWQKRKLVMATKLYPSNAAVAESYTHQPADLRRGLLKSLSALSADKIDLFYLHGPDRNTPFVDTLREVNRLYQEGYFTRFGLSNFMAWEVAQICELCVANGWIKPTVYQGVYHVLQRSIEPELTSCLRKYGISLYAFQPLAGGFLTGRYARDQTEFEAGSRFDPKILQGAVHQRRYWNEAYFDGLEVISAAARKYGLTVGEVALRWLKHHSLLRGELGDAIIVGASSVLHLESNLNDLEKGSLPDEVAQAVGDAWACVKGVVPPYWH
ncbi:Aldo/keto reductase [Aspergillus steynii IBT 23096]|uniref:Aldo/keto reductase n=1 Tax=Aspergillus steynii IBT 23096 TaxID=1392250 RepID=A0A2I2GC06_9EURO|nr:Aldo/keto reductase [Aspergillus steynii IBT 23096]PLB50395.1 Aldo/keto reductase [Aspergillus steynii IBT 23096]